MAASCSDPINGQAAARPPVRPNPAASPMRRDHDARRIKTAAIKVPVTITPDCFTITASIDQIMARPKRPLA